MIYIKRTPAPLDFYQMEWRTRYLRTVQQWLQQPLEQRGTPMPIELRGEQHRQLLALMSGQFAQKCAFCEVQLETNQQQLMYFRPEKNVQPSLDEHHYYWLSLDWSNLYLSCRDCWMSRGSEFPVTKQRMTAKLSHLERENAYPYFQAEDPLLLDPCLEVPCEYLQFNTDGKIFPVKATLSKELRSEQTIKLFDLNRGALVKARKQEAQQLKATWLDARKRMIECVGNMDVTLEALVHELTVACEPSAQFAGMKAYLLLEWLISETRIAPDSAQIFRAAIEQEPWRHLYYRAMTTLKIEKPRPTVERSKGDDAHQTAPAASSAGNTYINIQGDMYQISTISHSTLAIGDGASTTINNF